MDGVSAPSIAAAGKSTDRAAHNRGVSDAPDPPARCRMVLLAGIAAGVLAADVLTKVLGVASWRIARRSAARRADLPRTGARPGRGVLLATGYTWVLD